MTTAVTTAALMCTVAGALVFVAGASLGRWRDAVITMLDLWIAAGLLRLTGGLDPGRLAGAASIIAIRQVVGRGLRHGGGRRRGRSLG